MYEYFKGKLVEKTPAEAVIDCNGVAYILQISLQTFSKIKNREDVKLYTHLVVKDDSHTLFGFSELGERAIFRQLIMVSGVGANTARVILSSMTTDEVYHAIVMDNASALQSVKGIGAKTAQRIILDLIMLGFARQAAEKALQKVIKSQGFSLSVEDFVRLALKIL